MPSCGALACGYGSGTAKGLGPWDYRPR
uniref:Uncharacterized protein n=1 Tax=Arundo donax TaxID=35708 RepID=A0A0A9HL70_ARUDO